MKNHYNMQEHLKSQYGYNDFRALQKEIITDIIDKKDVMIIFPTGAGKSLCYQFPATFLDKVSIVISPLISLMTDQCTALRQKGIKVACLNGETQDSINDVNLIYCTPEFFMGHLELIDKLLDKICMIAIDEAHCLSEWGHDFRKEYTRLGVIREHFSTLPIMTLTATSPPNVSKDILNVLNIQDAQVYNTGVRRNNLTIRVQRKGDNIFTDLQPHINPDQSTIIYTQTCKMAEKIYNLLKCKGLSIEKYHGGLSADKKQSAYHNFITDKTILMVATICFGMGIDKPDIRKIINYGAPLNIETYYQEIGRAGRDGKRSSVVLFYSDNDFRTGAYLIGQSNQQENKQTSLNTFRKYLSNTMVCRQTLLEWYFKYGHLDGQIKNKHRCKHCDNCNKREHDTIDITQDVVLLVKLVDALYCNLGSTKLVKILRGAKSFEQYPFFGEGSHHSVDTWKQIIDTSISMGFLNRKVIGKFNVIECGSMRLYTPILMQSTQPMTTKTSSSLNRLKTIRTRLARDKNIAPYMIASDTILDIIHEAKPKDIPSLLALDGISYEFITTYGLFFIEQKKTSTSSTMSKSYDLFVSGMSPSDIAKERGLKQQTIEEHIVSMWKKHPDQIDEERIGITDDMKISVKRAIDQVGTERLRPIKEIIGRDISYFQMKTIMIRN